MIPIEAGRIAKAVCDGQSPPEASLTNQIMKTGEKSGTNQGYDIGKSREADIVFCIAGPGGEYAAAALQPGRFPDHRTIARRYGADRRFGLRMA